MNLTDKFVTRKKPQYIKLHKIKVPLLHQTHKWKNILCLFVKE